MFIDAIDRGGRLLRAGARGRTCPHGIEPVLLRASAGGFEVVVLLKARAPGSSAIRVGAAVWLLAIAETISWGVLYYTFGVLLGPMAVRARVHESEVAVAFSLALLASGVVAPVVGREVDRRGPGAVMTLGALVGACGFLALAMVEGPLALYLVWMSLGVAHACTSYEPAFAAVTRWFPDPVARRHGLLVLTSVAGFASTIFVPLAAWLVRTRGLPKTSIVFACVLALVVTPLHLVIMRVRRPSPPMVSAATPLPVREPPRGALTMLAVVFAIHAFASTGASLFLFPSLVARHVSSADAAALAGLVGAAQVPARLFYEPMSRWIPSRARLSLLLMVQAVALVGWATLTRTGRVVALVAFGASNGLATLERATLVSDWFGLAGYGARSGVLAAASAFTRAAAPFAIALVVSRTSYPHAFFALAAALVVATAVQLATEAQRFEEGRVDLLRPSRAGSVDHSER